jgi:hypothetical protein
LHSDWEKQLEREKALGLDWGLKWVRGLDSTLV